MNTANQNFTPGPWITRNTGTSIGVFGRDGTEQVHCCRNTHTEAANALLISLAPELVEALRGLLELPEIHQCVMEGRARTIDALADARAVLAKLEGGR